MNETSPHIELLCDAILIAAVFAAILGCIAREAQTIPRFVQWIRKRPVLGVAIVATLLSLGPTTLRSKNGLLSFLHPPAPLSGESLADAVPFVLNEARTNGVAMVAPTTNAAVSQACLLHGASEQGEWIELETPFFRWETNDIRRLYASPGCMSFGTIIRMLPRRLYAKLGFAPAAGEDDVAFEQAEKKHSSEGHSLHA